MSFQGKKILISAGPTYEPIDPVRFIGNRSSGKMGYAIAEELANKGAIVELVSGPVNITTNHKNVLIHKVETAEQMYESCHNLFQDCEIAIMVAAVADYTVKNPANQKIKKKEDHLTLELIKTKDILKSLGERKQKHQTLVGFALETQNGVENASKKIKKKNLDFIILNSLQDKGAGFQHDTNKISIINKNNKIAKFELKPKKKVAIDIIDYLEKYIENDH